MVLDVQELGTGELEALGDHAADPQGELAAETGRRPPAAAGGAVEGQQLVSVRQRASNAQVLGGVEPRPAERVARRGASRS
jgi:hypothetical protein